MICPNGAGNLQYICQATYWISEFCVGNIERLQDCEEGHTDKEHVVHTRLQSDGIREQKYHDPLCTRAAALESSAILSERPCLPRLFSIC
jgi:hypothetical protein